MRAAPIRITYKTPKQLLNSASGFLSGYTHTLNPYAGCAFACSYCYVRQMPIALFREDDWGTWIDVKEQAADVLRKELVKAKRKGPVTIFMSSSTDPYQPIEHKEQLTRSLLEVIVAQPPDFLLVQTRSPLVTRDIDLLVQLGQRVRVSMTIESDLEEMRTAFTPLAPPIKGRLHALRRLAEAGVPTQAAIAPVLPSSPAFPSLLAEVVDRVCIDDYFMGDGNGGRRTQKLGIQSIYERLGMAEWYDRQAYLRVYEGLKVHFPDGRLFISRDGFLP